MPAPDITVAELLEIRTQVEKQALEKHGSRYDDPNRAPPSVERLEAIVAGGPNLKPTERAAWLVRGLVLLQPFPDRNGLTGVLAAQLLLGRHGVVFRPPADVSETFHEAVSQMRFIRLGGTGEAPLSLLSDWDDDMYAFCLAFVEDYLEKAP